MTLFARILESKNKKIYLSRKDMFSIDRGLYR